MQPSSFCFPDADLAAACARHWQGDGPDVVVELLAEGGQHAHVLARTLSAAAVASLVLDGLGSPYLVGLQTVIDDLVCRRPVMREPPGSTLKDPHGR